MKTIISNTKRCIIRFALEKDYPEFVDGFKQSKESQNRFDEGKFDCSFMTKKWYSDLLKRRKDEAEKDYCYMFNIFRKSDGKSIGYCDITTMFREDLQFAKIGYTILNNYWNEGYATEVVQGMSEIGFDVLGFHRLEAHVNLDNNASKAVLKKSGIYI